MLPFWPSTTRYEPAALTQLPELARQIDTIAEKIAQRRAALSLMLDYHVDGVVAPHDLTLDNPIVVPSMMPYSEQLLTMLMLPHATAEALEIARLIIRVVGIQADLDALDELTAMRARRATRTVGAPLLRCA